jgi:hypothetical protein
MEPRAPVLRIILPMTAKFLLFPALIGFTGCMMHDRTGPMEYSSKTLDMDKSESEHVELHIGAGELHVTDGAQKLLRADFSYNVPEWKPEVNYFTAGGTGNLIIKQPATHTFGGNTRYRWDVQLGNKVPMNLEAHLGAGQAKLDIGSLMLRGVVVHMGVGELEMDLRGVVKHAYDVEIHGGVGQATVRLPVDAAIYAEAHGGIGSINVKGLRSRDGHWESDAWEKSENKIRLQVHGGIGEIRLIAD